MGRRAALVLTTVAVSAVAVIVGKAVDQRVAVIELSIPAVCTSGTAPDASYAVPNILSPAARVMMGATNHTVRMPRGACGEVELGL